MAYRIKPVPIGRERGRRENNSTLRQPSRRGYNPANPRRQRHPAKYRPAIAPHRHKLVGMSGRHLQLLSQQPTPVADKGRHLPRQKQHRRHRPQPGREVAAARYLALLPRLLPPARGRPLCSALIRHLKLSAIAPVYSVILCVLCV